VKDPHSPVCQTISGLLQRIGDKWSLLVVQTLAGGSKRFNELRREIPSVSQRMLTLTLRGLERDGYILFLSRVARAKGIYDLVIAYGQMQCRENVKLVVAGTGPALEWLVDRVGRVAGGEVRTTARIISAATSAGRRRGA